MRCLIINADGYGFTAGTTRAIEECVEFGTVRSISANVNFEHVERLPALVRRHPGISVGCHINPVVGRPVLDPARVPSLVNEKGEFYYRSFSSRFLRGRIRISELRAEIEAQVNRTRSLAGPAFSHLDFHKSLNRLPGLYGLFLDVAVASGVGRIRTHRNLMGMEHRFPPAQRLMYLFGSPRRIPSLLWNASLRRRAETRRLALPDQWVGITYLGTRPNTITLKNYVAMLGNLPSGFSEFVAHPGYVDEELRRWSTYLEQREREREVLLDLEFRSALEESDVRLVGYREIPRRSGPGSVRDAAAVCARQRGKT